MPSDLTAPPPGDGDSRRPSLRRRHPASLRRHPALLACAGAAALVVGISACSASGTDAGSSSTTSSRSKTLIIAENEPPASFDPLQADNSTVDEVDLPAYDTLVKFNDSGQLVGDLAKSWKVSADGKSISMTLRSGVTFHNGAKLTATDVKYSLDRIKKANIDVATMISAYSSTTVTSPTQLTINLSAPFSPFVDALSRIYIVNSALVEKNAGTNEGQSWLATHDAGSGPYKLVSYTPNAEAQFTQYKNYWGGWDGQATTVEFKYLSDGAAEQSALNNGSVDLAMDIDPSAWASYEKNSKFVVNKANTNVVLYVFFKMVDSPTSNQDLREAISYAYDYPQHVTDILKGAGQKVTGVMPTGMQCYDPSIPQPTYDLAKAKQYLAASGLKNVTLTMTYLKATSEMEQAAALLQSNLKQIGITLKLDAITFPQYEQTLQKTSTTPELGMIYAFPANSNADAILAQNFDSKYINGGENYGVYVNHQVDSLLAQAEASTSPSQSCSLYDQAEKLIVAQTPTVNMANSQYVTVYSSRLSGYKYEPSHHQTVDVYRIKVSG
ncbi:MAG TPA: ABC transporter substrate-binding protein [Streptosporangiaceae bacterium]|jgi:peptide/nickel transport system substrate-binding protein